MHSERYASLLDLAGSSYYVVRAYRRAAELIRPLPTPVADLVRTGRVRDLRGVGPSLEARLRELVETGEIAHARELESEVEPELVGLGRFLGLSPKRAVEVGAGAQRSHGGGAARGGRERPAFRTSRGWGRSRSRSCARRSSAKPRRARGAG